MVNQREALVAKTTYVINGQDFSTLDEFYEVISKVLIPGVEWGRNLDAFNDILRGDYGTPREGFVLRWINSELSRERLGYLETIRFLERRLKESDPDYEFIVSEIEMAREGFGPTVFDWLVEIIRVHGPGGDEAGDEVDLELA
jgi:RNAse (barnase) inhibitor barstar